MAESDSTPQNEASEAVATTSSTAASDDVSTVDTTLAEQSSPVTYPSDKEQIYGLNNYKHGTFLSRGEGARSEKYKRWIQEKNKQQAQQLEKEEHSCLVKLNAQTLEVRNELRDLQSQRRPPRKHSRPSGSGPGSLDLTESPDCTPRRSSSTTSSPTTSSPTPNSLAPPSMNKGMRKSSSFGSLSSSSSGGALSSPTRKISGGSAADYDRYGGGPGKSGYNGAIVRKGLNTNASALKVKNLHSARALSKLNNGMDITY